MLKAMLSSLVFRKDDVVIMDMEAGLEHLGRGTASMMDQFIVVIEPGARSIQTYTRIKQLARDIGVTRVRVVANKVRDESDREGYRVVVEIKRDSMADVVLNQLYRFTPMQTTFGANMVALNGGRPETMTLRDLIRAFVDFREEVVSRRTKFLLAKARDRAHVLCGLAIAVANIDEVIHIIRSSKDPAEARERLVGKDWPAGDMMALVELIADPLGEMYGEHVL